MQTSLKQKTFESNPTAWNDDPAVRLYGHYCRPATVELLEAMCLHAVYERAQGDFLWQRRGDELVQVLDLVGGFGANLFGHYHPELVAEERRLTEERVPILAQGSCRSGAARLAEALCDRLGDYIVIFTNTGTETIEAAIKHSYLERRRPVLWALENAFHGKTLGSIQMTWSYRQPFEGCGPRVRFLNPYSLSECRAAEEEADEVAAVFVEPIQGEGGVNVLPEEFVRWVTAFCKKEGIPLVVDEIQSGMGRTGSFLASEQMGLDPDYLCLSKSLGGSLSKIGALLVKRSRFVDEFSIKHTSTFAEDDRGCLLALKALEILERDDLPALCEVKGNYLLERLERLRARFPGVIKDVRGKGLIIGVELQDLSDSESNSLRMLSQQEYLSYMATAYLLNVHRIRVGPTLSQPFTLRIEPSAYISQQDLDRFLDAFSCFCEALTAIDMAHLTAFQVGLPSPEIVDHSGPRPFKREEPMTDCRVAFIGHLILPEHAALWDPSLNAFSPSELEEYMARPSRVLAPTLFDRVNVLSRTGDIVHLSYIGLDLTPRQIIQAKDERDFSWIMDKIEEAVAMARDAGCQVVGLGGYTSILSGNCQRIKTQGCALTSGNSLTVGMGVAALKKATEEMGIELSRSCLGVLGATGNIASTYAVMMAPHVESLLLVVHDLGSARLRAVENDIRKVAPHIRLSFATTPSSLRDCSLIVAASNVPGPLIFPECLAPGPVVICDISLPSDVADEVSIQRPDVMVIQGGVVRLPRNDDFVIAGIPLENSYVYACMAETLLMGLEGMTAHGSYGLVTTEGVHKAMLMAEKHGFTLGHFKTEGLSGL